MKLITNNKTYAQISFVPDADGCVISANEDIVAGETLSIITDDGVVLREYVVSDDLHCETQGKRLTLSSRAAIVPIPEDLNRLKAARIAASKAALEAHLAAHPLLWEDGKRYSVTAEKQALLNNTLTVYQLAAQAGQEAEPTWNATGEEGVSYTFETLRALALDIARYVNPLVAQQQALEVRLRAAEDAEAVNAVAIEYTHA